MFFTCGIGSIGVYESPTLKIKHYSHKGALSSHVLRTPQMDHLISFLNLQHWILLCIADSFSPTLVVFSGLGLTEEQETWLVIDIVVVFSLIAMAFSSVVTAIMNAPKGVKTQ